MSYVTPTNYNFKLSSVGDYKQYTSTWGSITTSCGSTIHAVGCVITAFANILKFKGKSDNPGQVQSKMKNSGNADCPFDWSKAATLYGLTYTRNNGNFDQIKIQMFNLIAKQRTPFIVYVTNSGGTKSHAVTVVGFNGTVLIDDEQGVVGSSIKPEMFLINDPGSSSRTTLKQMLDYYGTSVPIRNIAVYR
jgi:hypothetical protein